jgi:hypothetical protein
MLVGMLGFCGIGGKLMLQVRGKLMGKVTLQPQFNQVSETIVFRLLMPYNQPSKPPAIILYSGVRSATTELRCYE